MMSHTPPSSYSPLPRQPGFSSSTSMAERNDLHDMSPDDLEVECQHLRDENHQLQLRILGVNELARLLQDRSELVQVLEEKNKRLEIAVVRLENRCANYDRMLKSQKGANVPTAKPGQSPFIPGPSRQILEGLMKENSDLKKTVSSLTGQGAAGYLEAVKATQLEEVIDQQKQEIEFLKDQINQLTGTGIIEEKGDSSLGQLSSLPTSVSDSGPLKRQVIQLQRAMKVKDRFCTLLSQQVSQLQNRLASLNFETQDGEGSTTTAQPQQETPVSDTNGDSTYKKLFEEAKDTMAKEREERVSLVEKMSKLETQLKEKGHTIDKLEQRCDELTSYHQTLLLEKTELNQMLSETQQRMESLSISSSEGGSPQRSTSEPNIERLKKDLKSSADQISDLRAQLEEANIQTAIANSQLGTIESRHAQQMEELDNLLKVKNQEVRGYQDKMHQNEFQITELEEKVKDLEEDIRAKDSEYSDLLREISEGKHSKPTGGISREQIKSMMPQSGGAPSLFGLDTPIGPDDVAVKDYAGTPQQPQKMRNPSMQIPLLPRGSHQKQPPTNLDLHNTQQPPQGRASPAPHGIHPSQMVQAKGPQQQLPTPATPLAPNQGNYASVSQPHQSYTHPMGTVPPSSASTGYSGGGSQMMYGTGNVNVPMGQQPRMQQGQGGMTSRPRTMPITSPSPTPGSTQRMLGTNSGGSVAGVRAAYTANHPYSGAPISTTAQYGGSGVGIPYSTTGVVPTSSYGVGGGGVPNQGGYVGGRGMQQRPMQQYSSGQGPSVFGGNTQASHMYGSSSPQLQHQQFQQLPPYSRTESSSSGYGSGDISYSGGMAGGSGMRPTSPRSTFGQQSSTGGYQGSQQGGPSGQYGMRPTSPRSGGTYDPSGSYPGGQGGGAGGQHGFPPRGQH